MILALSQETLHRAETGCSILGARAHTYLCTLPHCRRVYSVALMRMTTLYIYKPKNDRCETDDLVSKLIFASCV